MSGTTAALNGAAPDAGGSRRTTKRPGPDADPQKDAASKRVPLRDRTNDPEGGAWRQPAAPKRATRQPARGPIAANASVVYVPAPPAPTLSAPAASVISQHKHGARAATAPFVPELATQPPAAISSPQVPPPTAIAISRQQSLAQASPSPDQMALDVVVDEPIVEPHRAPLVSSSAAGSDVIGPFASDLHQQPPYALVAAASSAAAASALSLATSVSLSVLDPVHHYQPAGSLGSIGPTSTQLSDISASGSTSGLLPALSAPVTAAPSASASASASPVAAAVEPALRVDDIDAADEGDPAHCSVYVEEIYEYLRQLEREYRPSMNYLENQSEITPRMRAILVDWLVDVSEEYQLSPETLSLTVNYLDRYLSLVPTSREELQLIGMVCSFIAAKFEEVDPPLVDDYIFISDFAYDREQIVLAESKVLTALKFSLCAASHRSFLRRFLKAAHADDRTRQLAGYLCELTLVHHTFNRYPTSLIACSAVCLALHTLGLNAWTPTYQYYVQYSTADVQFQHCLRELHQLHRNAVRSPYQSVYEKYSHAKYNRVALIAPLP